MYEIITGIKITLKELIILFLNDVNIYLYEYLKKCDHIPILDFNKFIKDTNNCLDLTVDFYLNIKINKSDNVYRWINYLFYDTDEINYLCNHINKNNDIKIFFKDDYDPKIDDIFNTKDFILGYGSVPIIGILSFKEIGKYIYTMHWLNHFKEKIEIYENNLLENTKLSVNMINNILEYTDLSIHKY